MSFLNPVNEPVLRFSSTDAGAPQINYNARTAGDVKAVLKACLVTGYGAKASAGWTAANETATVIEFVSPSAAMSDYRLGIDDTSAASTVWYYQYQDARVNPTANAPTKAFSAIFQSHANNGWQLLVSARGFVFIELVQHSTANNLSARITNFGQIKSALVNSLGENMMFFNIGHNSTTGFAHSFYSSSSAFARLSSYTDASPIAAVPNIKGSAVTYNVSAVELASSIFIVSALDRVFLGQLPTILAVGAAKSSDLYGVQNNIAHDGRSVLRVTAGYQSGAGLNTYASVMLIYTDYWEY